MRTEEICPQLLQGEPGSEEAFEARLDAHLRIPTGGSVAVEWVDVTSTHPWRQSARKRASEVQGHATSAAAQRKHARYGPEGVGVRARPFALGTWGYVDAKV